MAVSVKLGNDQLKCLTVLGCETAESLVGRVYEFASRPKSASKLPWVDFGDELPT